jgi:esterase/lipase/1-acyl-sn-glycerol-3-phosphate acyltransferase
MSGLRQISRVNINTMRVLIEMLLRVSRVRIIINGIEKVPHESVVFVSNHFTRVETILLPYIIYTRLGVMPRSLTATSVFNALPRDFMESVGSVPVDLEDRDDLAVRSILSGESWIIFPEGRMVKDKHVIEGKRYVIHDGDTMLERPPHTGAAAIALRAQMAVKMMNEFLDTYNLGPLFELGKLPEVETFIVPVNITYYPLRVVETFLSRQVEKLVRVLERGQASPRFEEELKVESSLLAPGVEIIINFGKPKRMSEYVLWMKPEEVFPVSGGKHAKVFRAVISSIMHDYMQEIYRLTTVNPDHLAARLLVTMAEQGELTVPWQDFRKRAYLSALSARDLHSVHRQETVIQRPESLVVIGENSLDGFLKMGESEGLFDVKNGVLDIKEKDFKWPHDFNEIRLLNTVQVIHNELEPLVEVTRAVDKTLDITGDDLSERTVAALIRGEEERYFTDYTAFYVKGESKGRKFGIPTFSRGDTKNGVLLVHGYMASPEEMRPLAEYLMREGCTIYSVRLLGHGTSPYDLLTRNWEDWFYSVRVGYSILANLVEKVFVCGFSAGGALAWHLAAQNPPKFSGIVSISAAMKLVNRSSMLAPAVDLMDRVVRFVGLKKSGIEFVKNSPENPHINYFKNPVHGVDQLLELVGVVKKELEKVTVPALILQGGQDPTVDPESAEEYYRAISSKLKEKIIVDSPYHGIVYRGSDEIFSRIAAFVRDPEKAARSKSKRKK